MVILCYLVRCIIFSGFNEHLLFLCVLGSSWGAAFFFICWINICLTTSRKNILFFCFLKNCSLFDEFWGSTKHFIHIMKLLDWHSEISQQKSSSDTSIKHRIERLLYLLQIMSVSCVCFKKLWEYSHFLKDFRVG